MKNIFNSLKCRIGIVCVTMLIFLFVGFAYAEGTASLNINDASFKPLAEGISSAVFSNKCVQGGSWHKENKDWYHIDTNTKKPDTNTWVYWSGNLYYVGQDGKMLRGNYVDTQDSSYCYFDNQEDTGFYVPNKSSKSYSDIFKKLNFITTTEILAPTKEGVAASSGSSGHSGGSGGGSTGGGSSGGGSKPTPTPTPTPPSPTGPTSPFKLDSMYYGTAKTTDGNTVVDVVDNAGITPGTESGVAEVKYKFLINKDLTASPYSGWSTINGKSGNTASCKVGIENGDELTFVTDGDGFIYPDPVDMTGLGLPFTAVLFYPGFWCTAWGGFAAKVLMWQIHM